MAHHYRDSWEWNDAIMPTAADRLEAWHAAGVGDGALEQVREALDSDLDSPAALAAIDAAQLTGKASQRRRSYSESILAATLRWTCQKRDDGTGGPIMSREAGQLWLVAKTVMTPLCRFMWRFRVNGQENLPTTGGAIMAPNHVSVIDSFFLPAVLPRRITYVGKAEYMDDWKTRSLFPALGMIPIDRSGGSASQRALDTAAGILNDGELFGIYPEGTRSRSGFLHKGRTGVARLAMRTGAPIIPVGIRGTREIQPPDRPAPKPFMTVEINIGTPIDPGRFRARDGDPLLYREITDELMFEIAQLSGQEYVHEYASAPTTAAPQIDPVSEEPLAPQRSSTDLLASGAA